MNTRYFRFVFWTGMSTFLILIGTSAVLYPGGNRFDLKFPHFSILGNFLCDLFDRDGYNGIPNPGRPYAVISAYVFAVTMLLFWLFLPKLFKNHPRQERYVRILGATSMFITLFIATPLHNLCINTAVPLAITAFLTAIHALMKSGENNLARLGIASVGVCIVNYLSLIFRVFPGSLPGLQKLTLLVFLIWVSACVLQMRKAQKNRPE